MSRKSKQDYSPQKFETKLGTANCNLNARIYCSMMESNAWMKLNNNARLLYLYMKMQYYGQKTISGYESNLVKASRGYTSVRPSEYFYFNEHLWKHKYKLFSNNSSFYKARDMLVEYGFIEIVVNGRFTQTRSVYKLSDKWQEI